MSGEIAQALADGVLNGPELARIVKAGVMGLRMVGVSHRDLDQVQVITTRAEYEMLPFKDGDVIVYGPEELTSKLKMKV
jgi:hypothetical protein